MFNYKFACQIFCLFTLSLSIVHGFDGPVTLNFVYADAEQAAEANGDVEVARFLDREGKVIGCQAVKLGAAYSVSDMPEQTVKISLHNRPRNDSDVAYRARQDVTLIPGKTAYEIPLVRTQLRKVEVTVAIGACGFPGDVQGVDAEVAPFMKEEKFGTFERFAVNVKDHTCTLYALPGARFTLEGALKSGVPALHPQSPEFTVADGGGIWDLRGLRRLDVSFHEVVSEDNPGETRPLREINIIKTVDTADRRRESFFLIKDGRLELNLDSPFSDFNKHQGVKFFLCQPWSNRYTIVAGDLAPMTGGEHKIILKRFQSTYAQVTDKAGTPLASLLVGVNGKPVATAGVQPALRHAIDRGLAQELLFFAPGYRAKRFQGITVDADTAEKITVGQLEDGEQIRGTVANAVEFSAKGGNSPALSCAVAYPFLFPAAPMGGSVDYDAATGSFTAKCDLRLRPHLLFLYRHNGLSAMTVHPLSPDCRERPLAVTLRPGTLVSGILPPELRALRDDKGRAFDHLVFVNPETGIMQGISGGFAPDGKWQGYVKPGEYRLLLCGNTQGVELGKAVVGDKALDLVLPVPENLGQIKPAAIPELLMGSVPTPDWSVIP